MTEMKKSVGQLVGYSSSVAAYKEVGNTDAATHVTKIYPGK